MLLRVIVVKMNYWLHLVRVTRRRQKHCPIWPAKKACIWQ